MFEEISSALDPAHLITNRQRDVCQIPIKSHTLNTNTDPSLHDTGNDRHTKGGRYSGHNRQFASAVDPAHITETTEQSLHGTSGFDPAYLIANTDHW